MIHTLQFNLLSALALDFVDHNDGFLYLRMAGPEATVNAIWAHLSARETRGQKWGGAVQIPITGRSHPEYVAAQKRVTYRTLRSRLPSGMVDLAMVHPVLTVAEDTERGFYLLTYEDDLPSGFFERLNKTLAIPLKPEWASWLWEQGQQPQSRLTLNTRKGREGGQEVEKTELVETTETPITRLSSLGAVTCYRVQCGERYKDAWLQIIRAQLDLSIRLKTVPDPGGGQRYLNGRWTASSTPEGWALHQDNDLVIQAPSINHLLTEARETLGLHFIIVEKRQ